MELLYFFRECEKEELGGYAYRRKPQDRLYKTSEIWTKLKEDPGS